MKKTLVIILSVFIIGSFLNFTQVNAGQSTNNCNFKIKDDGSIDDPKGLTGLVENCMNDTSVVAVKEEGTIEKGFKDKINNWTTNIALFLALLSVGSVIYGGLMMTISVGEDEKIKKAKDIVKWALVGFLGVVLATTIVTLVINVIYGLA